MPCLLEEWAIPILWSVTTVIIGHWCHRCTLLHPDLTVVLWCLCFAQLRDEPLLLTIMSSPQDPQSYFSLRHNLWCMWFHPLYSVLLFYFALSWCIYCHVDTRGSLLTVLVFAALVCFMANKLKLNELAETDNCAEGRYRATFFPVHFSHQDAYNMATFICARICLNVTAPHIWKYTCAIESLMGMKLNFTAHIMLLCTSAFVCRQ